MQRKNSGRKPNPDKRTNRAASATKSGPGRFHSAGHSKATPIKPAGAPRGFVLHQASAPKRARRADIKAAGGIRQYKRQRYAARDAAKVAA